MLLSVALSRPYTTTPEMLEEALQNPQGLKWYIIPLFVIWLYLIVNEIKHKRYSVVFGAAAIFFFLSVLAHHNKRGLNSRNARQHKIEQHERIRVECF